MIEIVDSRPDVHVPPAEYARLLGYPPDWVLRGRARDLADWACDWYARHGHPWVYARHSNTLETAAGSVMIDGVPFTCTRLLKTLRNAHAHGAVLAAVAAGPELEQEALKLWEEGKPDEYFFLEVYGSAVVEHLVMMMGARLCAWAEIQKMAVLPHYSPGYPGWTIEEQPRLLELISRTGSNVLPFPLSVFDSGMLRPEKSLLALFGLTRHTDRVRRLTDLSPCQNCSFVPCQYRRTPYGRAPQVSNPELSAVASGSSPAVQIAGPLDRQAT